MTNTQIPLPTKDSALALHRANGNAAVAEELHGMLISDLPIQKENLIKARSDHDIQTMAEIVHRLHGGCCYCGVPALEKALRELEHVLKIGDFQQELEQVITAIDHLLGAK